MSRYHLTETAVIDLASILDYIGIDRPSIAVRVAQRFTLTFEALASNSELGHVREDLTKKPVRFWPIYSYLVVYRADTRPLQILRVLSGYRDIAFLLERPEKHD